MSMNIAARIQTTTKPRMFILSALLFAVCLGITGVFVKLLDDQYLDEKYAAANMIGTTMASAMQRQLDRSLSSTYAIASLVRQNENHTIDNFDSVAADMTKTYGGIDSLQLAPNGVVSQIFPLAGNETAIGHDLLKDPARRVEALAAIESRELTLAGPFTLVQGGVAVIGRFPVFIPHDTGGDRFWGFTIALIRMSALLEAINLEQIVERGYDYELSRIHPDTGDRHVFARSAEKDIHNATAFAVETPNRTWTLHLAPLGGWRPGWLLAIEIVLATLISALVAILFYSQLLRTAERRRGETELRLQGAALRESEARFRDLYEDAPLAYFSVAMDGHIHMVNRSAEQLLGYARSSLIGRSVIDLYADTPSGKEKAHHLNQRIRAGEAIYNEELEMSRVDGASVWVSLTVRIISDVQGRFVERRAVVVDVTESKRAEKELRLQEATLRESEERFRQMAENLKEVYFMVDHQNYNVLYVNPAFEEIWGLPCESLYEQPTIWLSSIHSEDRERVTTALENQRITGEFNEEFRIIRPDGSVRWISDQVFQIRNEVGEIYRLVGIAEDITHRKRVEEALRESEAKIQQQARDLVLSNAELTQANQAKSEFIVHMSHELRTPLNAALGFAQMLNEPAFGPLSAKQQRFVDNIVTSGSHLSQLIDDIIDISKIETGNLELDISEVDVGECLSSCYSISAGIASNKGITFNVEYPPKCTVISVDERKLKQIVFNLLSNAMKFTPEGGKVRMKAYVVRNELHISVEDTGIGVEPQYQQGIFDLFDQGAPEMANKYGGSGLGLPLVRELAELHGGRVWLKSAEGEGSTFTVALPLDSVRQPDMEEE